MVGKKTCTQKIELKAFDIIFFLYKLEITMLDFEKMKKLFNFTIKNTNEKLKYN